MDRLFLLLKKHFLAGLFVLLPIGVAIWLLAQVGALLWQLRELVPGPLKPEAFFADDDAAMIANIIVAGFVTLLVALGISFVGWFSKRFLGRKVIQFLEFLILRIPVVRSIYSALDQFLKTMANGGGNQFNRVVYVEYPRKGSWALAFVTGPAKAEVLQKNLLNVYVPTTPNPTSGFHLIVPEADVVESGLSVEEAFKTILSLGIAQS